MKGASRTYSSGSRARHIPWMRRPVLLMLFVVGFLCPAAHGQDGDQPVTVTDLLKIRELGNVALSPDGRQILYSVRSIVPISDRKGSTVEADPGSEGRSRETYAYRTHLHLADPLRPADNRQLTRGDHSATEPAWHPDSDRIAFVRPVDGTPQIFILPLLGGEAYAVTNLESGATSPRWSPDGTRLLFSSKLTSEQVRSRTNDEPDWPIERPGRRPSDSDDISPDPNGSLAEIRAYLDANAARRQPRVFHRMNFLGETDLDDLPKYKHWFIVQPNTAAEPVLITRGHYDFEDGEWMADGSRVIVSGMVSAEQHPDRVWDTELYTAAVDGSGMQPFFAIEGYSISSPVVAPDGNSVAFIARRVDRAGYAQSEIGVVSVGDALTARLLTLDFDRSASAPKWSPDGWRLYFTAASNGGFPLYRVAAFGVEASPEEQEPASGETPDSAAVAADTAVIDADTSVAPADSAVARGDMSVAPADTADARADSIMTDPWQPIQNDPAVERLTSFDRGIRSFDVGSATVFYVATEAANPYELFASDTPFTSDRRLTDHNAEWLVEKRLSFPESHTLARDGVQIQYWIMKPAFFDSTGEYPLLLQIHGGPSAMWGPGEASMWHEFQFFASRGYGIVFSNPRGSGGYGYDFRRANYQDWGAGPAGDVLEVASEVVREPWLDENRQVVTGGSYAGYLTAWIVAHDHRFKAAVAQRGVYDLGTFLGEGNAWRLVPTHFGGYPWDREVDSAAVADPRHAAAIDGAADTSAAPDSLVTAAVMVPADTTATADSLALAADPSIADTSALGTTTIDVPPSVSEILIRNSPLTYLDRIQTPLLIIHGDQDLRTGVAQSEVLYKSLKILERPVEYVRYPTSGHELSRSGDPLLRMDRILRIYEFMERFIR